MLILIVHLPYHSPFICHRCLSFIPQNSHCYLHCMAAPLRNIPSHSSTPIDSIDIFLSKFPNLTVFLERYSFRWHKSLASDRVLPVICHRLQTNLKPHRPLSANFALTGNCKTIHLKESWTAVLAQDLFPLVSLLFPGFGRFLDIGGMNSTWIRSARSWKFTKRRAGGQWAYALLTNFALSWS